MATTPTNKPIPSEDPRDLKFNAGKYDEVINSDAHYYTDRFGVRRWTIAGFQYTAEEAIRNYGYITMDSFEDGATLTLPNQVLRYEATGEYYRWDGEFPKTVPAGSTPATTGGIGIGAWLSVGDAALRSALSNSVIDSNNKTFGALTKDVEYFGAIGDGVTDDTSAWLAAAAWVTGGNYRHITTRGGKIYRVTSTVDFNFANGRGHSILMKSPIRPDDGTGIAFLIQNTRNSTFDLKVDGGGGTLVDYSQPDPSGAQEAFVLRGIRECDIKISGLGYRGRVLRTKALDVSTGGVIKTSFNTINIYTGDRGAGQTIRCGQSMYLQGDDSAYGKIQTAWIPWDEYGSVLEKLTDITVGNIEFGADTIGGLRCIGLASAHIRTLAGGDETLTNTILRFENHSDGTQNIGVNIERIFCIQGALGVYFQGSNGAAGGTRSNFTVKSIYTNGNTAGVQLDGVNNSEFNIVSRDLVNGLKLSGTLRGVNIKANISNMSGAAILGDATANINSTVINGRAIGGGAVDGTVDLFASALSGCVFRDFSVSTGSGACYKLPVTNGAKMLGGAIDKGAGVAFSQGIAKEALSLDGFVTRNRGAGSIAIGNQTITITHGLAQQPTEISITPLATASPYRVLNINATTFDVRLDVVASGSAWTFNWFASCEYH